MTYSSQPEVPVNIHKNARTTPRGRALMIRRVLDEGEHPRAVAAGFGVSPRTAYKWLARFRAGGLAALDDRSSAPRRSPHRLAPERIADIAALRRRRMSSTRIAHRLGVPTSTVVKTLRRLGLNRLKSLEPQQPVVRYERKRPGELVHIDTKKLGRIDGVGHRITGDRRGRKRGSGWEYLHVCIDDHSRLAYTEILDAETGQAAAEFLSRAAQWFERHDVTIERVMTDNAFAYTNSHAFKAVLGHIGARHIRTKPYTPRTNGKAERFIQTCLREWLYATPYAASAQRTAAMAPWIEHYNLERPHAALNSQPPISRLSNEQRPC